MLDTPMASSKYCVNFLQEDMAAQSCLWIDIECETGFKLGSLPVLGFPLLSFPNFVILTNENGMKVIKLLLYFRMIIEIHLFGYFVETCVLVMVISFQVV